MYATSTNSDASLIVRNNRCTASSNTAGDWYGVFTSNTVSSITDNTFSNVTKTSTGFIRVIETGAYPSLTRVTISNNTIFQLTTTNASIYALISISGTAQDSLNFSNNKVYDISVTGGDGNFVYAETDAGAAPTAVKVTITNNSFVNCILSTTAVSADVIYALRGNVVISGNTINEITAPNAVIVRGIFVESADYASVTNNSCMAITHTASVDGITVGSSVSTISENILYRLAGTVVVGISLVSGTEGTVTGNSLDNLLGTSTTWGVYLPNTVNVNVSSNRFNNTPASGTLRNVYIVGSGTGVSITNNSFTAGILAGIDILLNDTVLNAVVSKNQFSTLCVHNVSIVIPPGSTGFAGNTLIEGNVFDGDGLTIPAHRAIYVDVGGLGSTGGYGQLNIANNAINRASDNTDRAIEIIGNALGGSYGMGGISIVNNLIQDTGGLLQFTGPIAVGTIAGAVMDGLIIKGNQMLHNGTAGDQLAIVLTGIRNLTFSDNFIYRLSGANSCISISNTTNFVISGNSIESNTAVAVFNGTTGPSTWGTIIGNTVSSGLTLNTGFTSAIVTGNRA